MMKRVLGLAPRRSPGSRSCRHRKRRKAPGGAEGAAGGPRINWCCAEGRQAERVRCAAQGAHEAQRSPCETQGQTDWVQPVVDDDNLHADYISMGAAAKETQGRFKALVELVADPGRDIDSPKMATAVRLCRWKLSGNRRRSATSPDGKLVGIVPRSVLKLDCQGAEDVPMESTSRSPFLGFSFVPVLLPGKGAYAEGNKPWVDFNAVAGRYGHTRRADSSTTIPRRREHHHRPGHPHRLRLR